MTLNYQILQLKFLEVWGKWITPSLPLLPGPLWGPLHPKTVQNSKKKKNPTYKRDRPWFSKKCREAIQLRRKVLQKFHTELRTSNLTSFKFKKVWSMLLHILLPLFMFAHYWKANDVNDADKRTFKKRQNKQK